MTRSPDRTAASPARTWSSRRGGSCSRSSTSPARCTRTSAGRGARRRPTACSTRATTGSRRRADADVGDTTTRSHYSGMVSRIMRQCGSRSPSSRRRCRSSARRASTSCDRCCPPTRPASSATSTAPRSRSRWRSPRSASRVTRSRRSRPVSGRSSPPPGRPRSLPPIALLQAFRMRNFALGTVYSKTEVIQVAIVSALVLHEPLQPARMGRRRRVHARRGVAGVQRLVALARARGRRPGRADGRRRRRRVRRSRPSASAPRRSRSATRRRGIGRC